MTPLIVMADGAAPFWLLAQTGTPAAAPTSAPAVPSSSASATSGTSTAVADPNAAPPSPLPSLLMPILLFAGIYFLLIAPQSKRNKQHQKLLKELKTGDEVMTSSGLFGTITQVKPDRFVVEIAKGVRVEVNRANVEARAPADQPADEKKA